MYVLITLAMYDDPEVYEFKEKSYETLEEVLAAAAVAQEEYDEWEIIEGTCITESVWSQVFEMSKEIAAEKARKYRTVVEEREKVELERLKTKYGSE